MSPPLLPATEALQSGSKHPAPRSGCWDAEMQPSPRSPQPQGQNKHGESHPQPAAKEPPLAPGGLEVLPSLLFLLLFFFSSPRTSPAPGSLCLDCQARARI